MKIGILSMQKVMNYGSFLQGFALKKIIEGLGHECEYVDIEQGKVFTGLKRTPLFIAKKIIERYLKWDIIPRLHYVKLFKKRFTTEFFDLLGVNNHIIQHFNTVVIGSDEVFNFAQRVPWGYTPQLYGKVSNTDKVISYAGSFGHTTIKDIEYYKVKDEINKSLCSMAAISVRDKNSFDIVKEITGISPCINIDPVLVYDFRSYIKYPSLKNYIIIYSYPNRINNKKEIEAIKSFAKKYNKRLISIGFYFPWCDETIVPDPFEVLGYINKADFIITDTFHGSVMSLKFNRPFIALVRNSNKQKMTYLLTQFGLKERIVEDMNQLENIMMKEIDYNKVNCLLAAEKEKSLDYLNKNL